MRNVKKAKKTTDVKTDKTNSTVNRNIICRMYMNSMTRCTR